MSLIDKLRRAFDIAVDAAEPTALVSAGRREFMRRAMMWSGGALLGAAALELMTEEEALAAFSGWSTSNFIRLPSGLITAVPLSMAAWFLPTSAANGTILGLFTSGSAFNRNSFRLAIDTSPAVTALTADASSVANATTTAAATVSAWNHGAAVFSGVAARASYLNGGNKGTNTTSLTPSGINRTSVGLGDGSAASTPFHSGGSIAEAGIWNADLDDAEVASMGVAAVSPLLVRPSSLLAYLPMTRDFVDMHGNAFAVQGSLTVTDAPRQLRAI